MAFQRKFQIWIKSIPGVLRSLTYCWIGKYSLFLLNKISLVILAEYPLNETGNVPGWRQPEFFNKKTFKKFIVTFSIMKLWSDSHVLKFRIELMNSVQLIFLPL